jgi:hypothetical protein
MINSEQVLLALLSRVLRYRRAVVMGAPAAVITTAWGCFLLRPAARSTWAADGMMVSHPCGTYLMRFRCCSCGWTTMISRAR